MIRTAQLNLAKWPVTEPYLGLVVISLALVARLALPDHYGKVSHLWYIGAWDRKFHRGNAEPKQASRNPKNTKNKMLSEKHGVVQHFKMDELFQLYII